MSPPYLIWTMQRTGSTALMQLLAEMSEHGSAGHERSKRRGKKPRQFASVARGWSEAHDRPAAAGALSAILSQRLPIKHCYELHPMPFNIELMQAAAKTDYRHVLLRQDELARLVKRFVANASGARFKGYPTRVPADVVSGGRRFTPLPVERVAAEYRRCRTLTAAVCRRMEEFGIVPHTVYYEHLFAGERQPRLERLRALLKFLGFAPQAIEEHRAVIDDGILNGGEKIRPLAQLVPNLSEVRQALASAEYGRKPAAAVERGKADSSDKIYQHSRYDEKVRIAELIKEGDHRTLVGDKWDKMGQLQLDFLTGAGLRSHHNVLDIGCGCLRAGVKLIPFLERNYYYGIDAEEKLLEVGYRKELPAAGLADRLRG